MIERVNLYVDKDDWKLLDEISQMLDKKRSEVVRDIISLFLANLKASFGDEPKLTRENLSGFYEAMLAIGKKDNVKENASKEIQLTEQSQTTKNRKKKKKNKRK
ncbi:ribbon-helix-helix domain-containing protein [Pelotomaculum terephthalicicum JT]|uniref:ribbon-helix-helix domain-containing protein n=1 Tax=Pelotomaculum terephthalicicum TaxID=206393 RepID=UPI001F047D13|nr:ribbon-helix-helix domain-containing protein [Pelotomaculum terephthalicicum]MCG9968619.1 ribbon-helix-helix domain-containing protein [Pelotomaculum terephthalicicum JT]